MKVEYFEKKSKPIKKMKKRNSRLRAIIIAVLLITLILAVSLVLLITVLFKVDTVKVRGSSIYSSDEIIYASGIMNGDNLFIMSKSDIEARIVKSLPYIKEAEIIKLFPNTVSIRVEPVSEKYCILTDTDNFIADESFKILKNSTENQDNLLKIRGIKTENLAQGVKLKFSDKQQRDILNDIMSIAASKGFNLSYINISSLVDISFAIDNRVLVYLGTYSNLSEKMTHLASMYPSVDQEASASISLKDYSADKKEAILKYEDISEYIK